VLEQQSFLMPGLELQKKLVPVFNSSAKLERDALSLIDSLLVLRKLLMIDLFNCSREAWVTKPLGEVFEVQLGKMLSKKSTGGLNPKPYLANFNVQWGRIDISELKQMDFNAREIDKFRLKKGDILVCEGGEIGRSAIWNEEVEECYYQKALHRLRPINSEEILPDFMLIYMDFMFNVSGDFSSQIMATTIAHIPREKLIKLPVSFPCVREQLEIIRAVGCLDNVKGQMFEEIQRVKVLNQAVLAGGM
jgi:type I restriction enzyme S subunit